MMTVLQVQQPVDGSGLPAVHARVRPPAWPSHRPRADPVCTTLIDVGCIFAISQYFFFKLSNYIACDNTEMMMPNFLGEGHIRWSCVFFFFFGYSDKASEDDTCSTEHLSSYNLF